MSASKYVDPLARLGRWDGNSFVPVTSQSISVDRVHVMTHGWAPGLAEVVAEEPELLRVWDERCTSPDGKRFDRWFGPLAEAILADDPEAEVLAFSWVDESATPDSAFHSFRSQLRTTINGQRLAVALRNAISNPERQLHLIGYSHGAKVATVAAALTDPVPEHLTILDSPDNLVPVLGGALNDLSSYLRLLAPGNVIDGVFIDNYPSHFGIHYGSVQGLGAVHDIELDPENHPLEVAPTGHAYAWAWYLETAKHPERDVGFAWSPLRTSAPTPSDHQLRQHVDPLGDPFDLESNPEVSPSDAAAALRVRVQQEVDKPRVLSTHGSTRFYGFLWRRSGDLWATAAVEWIHGPDDAFVSVRANRTERARSAKGWSEDLNRRLHVPLGGTRFGPMIFRIDLVSSGPAEVAVGRAAAVNGFNLPTGSEFQAWVRPVLLAGIVGTAVGIGLLSTIGIGRLRRRSR